MCTLWLIESLARAGEFDKSLLDKAVVMLEDYMGARSRVYMYELV